MISFCKSSFPFLLLLGSNLLLSVLSHGPATSKPSCGVDYGSSLEALHIVDPTISWSFQHYSDCTNRGVWISFDNHSVNASFYVGVRIPNIDRFSDVRMDALLIGPGLAILTEEEWSVVPKEIKEDTVWDDSANGALLLQSPNDQSTCNHLATVTSKESHVNNGRCDYYEPIGGKHSWPILDVENNVLPVGGAAYYLVFWVRNDMSSKFVIALGSWVEDFRYPHQVEKPLCSRNLTVDFYEEETNQTSSSPYVQCSNQTEIIDNNEGFVDSKEQICVQGEVCETTKNCTVDGISYETPSMVCGGMKCPAATALWEDVHMRMMKNMMDIHYTGNPDVDFVRNMIPHHMGAVAMCEILLKNLTCMEVSNVDNLDGLVHLCNHIKIEQEIEVGGMRRWLEERQLHERSPCLNIVSRQTEGPIKMIDSCGFVKYASSSRLIHINHVMHLGMAIDVSCNHQVSKMRPVENTVCIAKQRH
jgi:hypothetical protein